MSTTVTRKSDGRTVALADECLAPNTTTGELCSFKEFHAGDHSWAGLHVKAVVETVSRSTKKGVEIKFIFGKMDLGDVARLYGLVGVECTLTLVPDAEQPRLPGE